MTKRLMIVDSHNQFLRSYIVDPSVSSHGNPIGGCKGFLKILNKLCREIKPDLVAVVWDGEGGSAKRRSQNKNYKMGRKPPRLNRFDNNLSQEEQENNKIWQQVRAMDYLNDTPVIQFIEPGVEADDVISYIKSMTQFADWQKVIVSSDKDFIQVLDKKTVLFRPTQSEVLNTPKILEKYEIHPNNFALARAIVGDKSDNLAGVPGVGLATVSKRFPFLKEEKEYYIQDIIDECNNNAESKLKLYTNVAENENLIKDNYKIMQLSAPSISIQTKSKINTTFDNCGPEYNKTLMLSKMIKDGLGEIKLESLEQTFKRSKNTFFSFKEDLSMIF